MNEETTALRPSRSFTIAVPATPWTYPIWVTLGRYGVILEINPNLWEPGVVAYWHWGSGTRAWKRFS